MKRIEINKCGAVKQNTPSVTYGERKTTVGLITNDREISETRYFSIDMDEEDYIGFNVKYLRDAGIIEVWVLTEHEMYILDTMSILIKGFPTYGVSRKQPEQVFISLSEFHKSDLEDFITTLRCFEANTWSWCDKEAGAIN